MLTGKRIAATVMSVLALAGATMTAQANPERPAATPTHASVGSLEKFCTGEACKKWCGDRCTLNASAWTTTCPGAPKAAKGAIPASSPLLAPIPHMKYVTAAHGQRATQDVISGLKRLDDYLAASPSRASMGYTAHVKDCFRDIAHEVDVECGYIVKGWHIIDKWAAITRPLTEEEATKKRHEMATADRLIDPNKLGLAWPGADFHTSGNACDIVLVDSAGHEATSCGINDGQRTSKLLDVEAASKLLDEAITSDKVGAMRLDFEMWHYEWGGATGCRCKAPECHDKFWPPQCGGAHRCPGQ